MKLLVTGGAGFIGSHFVRLMLRKGHRVVNLDRLTYAVAGRTDNLADVARHPRYRFIRGDIREPRTVATAIRGASAVVNFAAESHVDRSIRDAAVFLQTNILGTQVLLDAARRARVRRFLQVSTDEVYGSREGAPASETAPLAPNSPYSASKAAADLLCRAYGVTHGLPVIITRSTNNFGPHQFPEKLIPLFILRALRNQPLPLYGDGGQVRDWLFVEDHCEGIRRALERGRPGEIYNFGAGHGRRNRDIVRMILKMMGKPRTLIQRVQDRPGHDRRYAVTIRKAARELGWKPRRPFAEALRETVDWYLAHPEWWRPRLAGVTLPLWARRKAG